MTGKKTKPQYVMTIK